MRALLTLLLPLFSALGGALQPPSATREFYIAAVEIGWDYIHLDTADTAPDQRSKTKDIPQKYIKAVYREYTDSTYTTPKPRPAWAGIQGPVIHAQAGERVVVHFKNLASQSYSISPFGVTYWKQSEGAGYDDSTAGQEKDDDAVPPGGYYEYVWDINPKDGPTISDPECLTYSYLSQVDVVRDTNSGLIGALLICKSSAFTEDGQRRSNAFILLFAVFDETKSWYGEIGERRSRERYKKSSGRKQYHTINGYVNSTLPGLTMCKGRDHVFWHLIGMGTAPEIHSIQFQDHSLQVMSHRKVTVEMTPMTFTTAEMKPATFGRFLISCQIHAHRHAGMSAFFTVEDCPEPVRQPGLDLRHVNHDGEDYGEDYSYEYSMFDTVDFPKPKKLRPRSSKGREFVTHYIAAEEITWDYAPHLKPTDSELVSEYLPTSPHRLGFQYKKVVYVEYTDETFTQRKNPDPRLFGPMLKGEVGDALYIFFKNFASRPFNIYPKGLTKIHPHSSNAAAAEKDLRSMGVPPNGTFNYVWRLTPDDGPLPGDPQCLTHLYQSTVNSERDLASGLVGTLLICKNEAIDSLGRLLGSDEERSLMFAVFDENRSWYINENIQKYSQDSSKINPTDPAFYNSNVIYSVNGVMFRGRQFTMCKSDVMFWHVANVGTQSDFLSIYFTGNPFGYHNVYQSVLTLFPMTAETVAMETELIGEWEISAFDGSLKSRGMSIRYSVRQCRDEELSLTDDEYDEGALLSDYIDMLALMPRSRRSQNRTVAVRMCKKPLANHNMTQTTNSTDGGGTVCEVRNVTMTSSEEDNTKLVTDEGIPKDILEDLERDGEWTASLPQDGNGPKGQGGGRQKRHEDRDDGSVMSGAGEVDGGAEIEKEREAEGNGSGTRAKDQDEVSGEWLNEKNWTKRELDESNEILLHSAPQLNEGELTLEPLDTQDLDQNADLHNHIQPVREPLLMDPLDPLDLYNVTGGNETEQRISLSLEYDDFDQEENSTSYVFGTEFLDLRSGGSKYYNYYIAAEEVTWDYGIRLPHQLIKPRAMRRGMRKFLPEYKKVVFRAYWDKDFMVPVDPGELQEHLGIMGPIIRAEINGLLTVTFKNKASRPYSFHLQGVYDRSQGAGFAQAQSSSIPAGLPGEAVPPGEARVYNWRITRKQGPTDPEFDCKAGAYYSTVDKERDLHSGLIGPLVICKPGTLDPHLHLQPGIQEYALLFHTFDETKSWYLEENLQKYCTPPCQANPDDPWFQTSNKFAAINGYVAETLPGLLVAQHQPVRWHLLNVGSDGEYHAVHFHGLSFSVHTEQEHRMGVYNLYPGVFGTVEMGPPTVGTWLVECTVGEYQLAGMRAKLLVYNPRCVLPLGMKSGRIEDSQITASNHIGNWEPRLARLDLSGSINAWMGQNKDSWIQVDLQKPSLVHGLQTQGARATLRDYFITHFSISYSLDMERWRTYRGNHTRPNYPFKSSMDGSKVKDNRLSPPIVARYIRIIPLNFVRHPALRLELLGCDLNSCSLPLGLQRGLPDSSFSASSFRSKWLHTWSPALARLHKDGSTNAWRPKNNNPHEWLQVDLLKVQRITGLVTQGAWSLMTQMMVTEFSITISDDTHSWSSVLEEGSQREQIFLGNNDPDEEALTRFDPPLFGRYLRVHPRGWHNDIALRLEVLGCDTQQ